MSSTTYRLVRHTDPARTRPPELDEHQRRVVEHAGGPLLVLAGPGTGKTTTIVEAVVDRIERRGLDPERVLVLTFGRKAAGELRERISARLRRTTRTPMAVTFHGYAYALLRREAVRTEEYPPRLLSGPEHLLEVRRLLGGEVADGAPEWPQRLREALATRGFAEELRDFILRAAERGLGPDDLRALGKLRGHADWLAVGDFLDRYDARFDVDPVPAYDYAELIRAATGLLADEDVRSRERRAYDAVFVDEYQDTDPAQEDLLRRVAGDGRELVVVGDPDQSIYGFRGADVRGILEFPDRFPTATGEPAPVVALRTCRRMGTDILAASRRVAGRLPVGGSGSEHRELRADEGVGDGEVRVVEADGAGQEAALVADQLRRAHLLDGVPWSRMAVLVRSAVRQMPSLRRALAAVGVPVVVAGDEVPLAGEPGTRPLITLLRCALHPALLTEETAEELLAGPLGGADALGLRRLKRALRDLARVAGTTETDGDETDGDETDGEGADGTAGGAVSSSLVDALNDARDLLLVHPRVREPADRVAGLLATARATVAAGGNAEEVLWAVWEGSGLADRLLAHSTEGGARGASADRDLDAVVALFEAAARFVDRLPHAGPALFLDDLASQEIPGDTLAERAPRGEAVRILTAHRAKGLEWDVVVVTGVQEGVWPDLRLRGSLLGADELVEIAAGGDVTDPEVGGASLAAKMLEEERRLFYVAVTRARRRLVVTAVGGEEAEERPSRFLRELRPGSTEHVRVDERTRWLSLRALVADLRSVVTDPKSPRPLRHAAAGHLARLARSGVQGADPAQWYALTSPSDAGPAFADDERIVISPSQVETFSTCGLRWLLAAAVGAEDGGAGEYATMGKVIHAVAELAGGDATVTENDVAERLDEIWDALDFRSSWYSTKQREAAERMVAKFLAWHRRADARELVAIEQPFEVDLGRVVVRGRVDRAERDDEGNAWIVDIKTSSTPASADDLPRHPQLGVYQYAVMLGAFADRGLIDPGGAELVQVGKASLSSEVRVQAQPSPSADPDPGWPKALVETVAAGMASPVFEARVNDTCRTCPVRGCCPAHGSGGRVTP